MKLKHFSKKEFSSYENMDENFLKWLDLLRERYGKPIRINSSYRDPNKNEEVGGVRKSAHTEIPCRSADLHVSGSQERLELVALAINMECVRIGIGETFIHLDFSLTQPQNVMWTYY